MKQQKIIFLLLAVTVVLTIILTSNVGYATVTGYHGYPPEQPNFRVIFTGKPSYTGDGTAKIRLTSSTTATMNIEGLSTKGDYVTAKFTIKNTSDDIYAKLYKTVTNTNKEYFKVTTVVSDNILSPRRDNAILTITVQLIKTPIDKVQTTNISVRVTASPIYDD